MITEDKIKEVLHEGDIIKNFKTLCEMLEVPYCMKNDNSGKALLKELRRYYDLDFKGQKILVLERYNTPFPKEDGRSVGNTSVFIQYIEIVLLSYLATCDGYSVHMTQRQLYETLGLVNEDYSKHHTARELGVDNWSLENFYDRSLSQLKGIVNRALGNLTRRSLIECNIQRIIVLPDGSSFVANEKQTTQVLNIENDVLCEMGLYDKRIAAFRHQYNQYQDRVNERLLKLHGWQYSYQRYNIITADSFRLLRDVDRNMAKLKLNQEVVKAINRNAEYAFAYNRKQLAEGKASFNFNAKYLSTQKHLAKCLISLDEKDRALLARCLLLNTDTELFE